MAGLIFLRTGDLEQIVEFYITKIGMERWVSQPDIEILQHDNLLVGFHQQDKTDTDALITFFYETKQEVMDMYDKLQSIALDPPELNSKYNIYNFFAKDPDGRMIEFQVFLHDLPSY